MPPESTELLAAFGVVYEIHDRLSQQLGVGFVPIRKAGKLPRKVVRSSNSIEYGKRDFEMHKNDIKPGERVLILDDVLATGGTIESAIDMVESVGGKIIELAFFMLMTTLGGREKTKDYKIFNIIDESDVIEYNKDRPYEEEE